MIAWLQHTHSITVINSEGVSYNVKDNHPYYDDILKALNADKIDEKKVLRLIDKKECINVYGKGYFKVIDNQLVRHDGIVLHGSLVERIIRLARENKPVKYLCKFLDNLYKNPSYNSIAELYDFLQRNDLPITEDGCFLAYKGVRSDYKDKYSGQFDNSAGQVLTMPRQHVDDDRTHECSYGFHAGRYEYARDYAGDGRLMIVKINPQDVVSVPKDYDCAKLRTCRYEVIAEAMKKEDCLAKTCVVILNDCLA